MTDGAEKENQMNNQLSDTQKLNAFEEVLKTLGRRQEVFS